MIRGTPNVIVESDAAIPAVRGIGSTVTTNQIFASGVVPRVPVLVDGVATPIAASMSFMRNSGWDVSTVEVTKGPQPTSTGRNAFAGAIRMFTNDPVFEPEYSLRLGGHNNRENRNGAFMINQPLIDDELAIRLTGERSDNKAIVKVYDPRVTRYNPNDEDYQQIRGKIRYAPQAVGGLDIQLTHADIRAQGQYAPLIEPSNARSQASNNNFLYLGGYETIERKNSIAEINYKLTDGLKLFTRLSRGKNQLIYPFKGTWQPEFRPFGTITYDTQEDELEAYLQFSGHSIVKKGVLGIVRNHQEEVLDNYVKNAPQGTKPFLMDANAQARNTGIYGEVEIGLDQLWVGLEGLTLIAGGRFEQDNRYRIVGVDEHVQSNRSFSENIFLPKLGARYAFDDTAEIGYTYSQSYRPAGVEVDLVSGFFTPAGSPNQFLIAEFDKETMESHEIHVKKSFLNDQLKLGGTAFHYIYRDAQVAGASPTKSAFRRGFTLIGNVPEAIGKGLELNADYTHENGITIGAAAGWLDTEITDAGKIAKAFRNHPLPKSPKFTSNLSVGYEDDSGLFVRTDARYVDDMTTYLAARQNHLSGYTIVDFIGGYDLNEQFSLDGYVTNLFDKAYLVDNSYNRKIIGRPRTIGLSLKAEL